MGHAAQLLATEFEALGHETTFAADLEAHLTAFKSANSDENAGEETQAGATANFDSLLSEALGKVKSLDAIIHHFYKSNAAKLGAWRTVSHVERQPKAKKAASSPNALRCTRLLFTDTSY
jgi:antirestriction protein ArdC